MCLACRHERVHLQAVYILTFFLVHLHQNGDFKIKSYQVNAYVNRFIGARNLITVHPMFMPQHLTTESSSAFA